MIFQFTAIFRSTAILKIKSSWLEIRFKNFQPPTPAEILDYTNDEHSCKNEYISFVRFQTRKSCSMPKLKIICKYCTNWYVISSKNKMFERNNHCQHLINSEFCKSTYLAAVFLSGLLKEKYRSNCVHKTRHRLRKC